MPELQQRAAPAEHEVERRADGMREVLLADEVADVLHAEREDGLERGAPAHPTRRGVRIPGDDGISRA